MNWVDPWGLSASDGQKNSPSFGSVAKNFGIGFAQGAWGAAKNIGQFIAHPIKTVQATANDDKSTNSIWHFKYSQKALGPLSSLQ